MSEEMGEHEEIEEYDKNNNLVYHKSWYGEEFWYDEKGNEVHWKGTDGSECWYEYDEKGNEIYHKIDDGREFWYKNELKNIKHTYQQIPITQKEFERIKRDKELLEREVIERFELMEL